MSSNWPDRPIIRIIKGYDSGRLRENVLAFRYEGGSSYRGPACLLIQDTSGDKIESWEEVTAIPTAALKRLQHAFQGVDVSKDLESPLLEVLSHLPSDKLDALGQAVTDVKSISERGVLGAFTTDDRVALLLNALGEVHTGTDIRYRLARVVRIAYTWADLVDLDLDALRDIRDRAAALLEAGPLEDPSITPMVRSAGLVAGCAGLRNSLREALVDLGTYALAWAAGIIAKGEAGGSEDL